MKSQIWVAIIGVVMGGCSSYLSTPGEKMFEAIYYPAPLSAQKLAYSLYSDTANLTFGDYASLGDYFLFVGRPAEATAAYRKADFGFRETIKNASSSYLAYFARSGGWSVVAKSYANMMYACLDQKDEICADRAIASVKSLPFVVNGSIKVPSFLLFEMKSALSIANRDKRDSVEVAVLIDDIWRQDSVSAESRGFKSLWKVYWRSEKSDQFDCGNNVKCLLFNSLSFGSQGATGMCENARQKMDSIGSLYSKYFSKRNFSFDQPTFPCGNN